MGLSLTLQKTSLQKTDSHKIQCITCYVATQIDKSRSKNPHNSRRRKPVIKMALLLHDQFKESGYLITVTCVYKLLVQVVCIHNCIHIHLFVYVCCTRFLWNFIIAIFPRAVNPSFVVDVSFSFTAGSDSLFSVTSDSPSQTHSLDLQRYCCRVCLTFQTQARQHQLSKAGDFMSEEHYIDVRASRSFVVWQTSKFTATLSSMVDLER